MQWNLTLQLPVNVVTLLLWPLYFGPSLSSCSHILMANPFNLAILLIQLDFPGPLVARLTGFYCTTTTCQALSVEDSELTPIK